LYRQITALLHLPGAGILQADWSNITSVRYLNK
jgi:hypothetical protein